jgi:predicted permease
MLAAGIDLRVLGVALLAGLVCVLLATLTPAWHASRVSLTPALREGSGATPVAGQRLRHALVVAQVALSLALVFGAGLLGRTLAQMAHAASGITEDRLLAFSLSPVLSGHSPDAVLDIVTRVREEVASVPGVLSVSAAEQPLLASATSQLTVSIPGYEPGPDEDMNPVYNAVTPGLPAALGLTVLAGRDLDERDVRGGPPVMLVNENFARHFFAGDAVGKKVRVRRDEQETTIVGVVSNYRHHDLREDPARRMILLPAAQQPTVDQVTFYVRTGQRETDAAASVRDAVRRVAPTLPVYDLRTMADQRQLSVLAERASAWIAGAFAALAVLLAAVGLYGTLSHGVTQRLREIGVRLALGAEPRAILRLVVGQAGRLVLLGLLLGAPLAWLLATLVRTQLFQVAALDPVSVAGAAGALLTAAGLAALVPAVRASATDPATTLRCE